MMIDEWRMVESLRSIIFQK